MTAVLVLLGGALGGGGIVAAQAFAARRLLGVRLGAGRTIVAGAVGWAAFGLVGRRLHDPVEWWLFLPLLLGISILATTGVLVAGEVVFPSGGRPLRALRGRVVRARRYSEITAIAVRHGLRPYLRGRGAEHDPSLGRTRLARSLRMALEEGGVTFVKLGQMLSTRPDLLPPEMVEELGRLQERAVPVAWPDVRSVIEADLGALETTFATLDTEPLASASVAQVHAGRLRSGEDVVVKVQRPGVAAVVERDLEVLLRLAATIEARRRRGMSVHATVGGADRSGVNVVELAQGFAAAIREELDFRIEARNIATVTAGMREIGGEPLVRIPTAHEALTSRRVMVMERLHGAPIRAARRTVGARGLDPHTLAAGLLGALLRQIMRIGVFHADPHPGNVLLLDDGRVGLLDFGTVGRIDPLLQAALTRLLVAVERRDPAGLRDALLELAQQPDDVDEERLTRDLGRFAARHLAPGTSPDAAMFVDLFAAVVGAGLTVPPEAAAVFRALATLDGTLTQLDPSFDIVAEARGFARTELAHDLPHVVRDELAALLPLLGRLPRRVDRVTGALEQGRLTLNIRLLADERDRRVITTLHHQTLLAVLGAATGLMSVLLLAAHAGPRVSSTVTVDQLLGYNLLIVSLLLTVRVLFVVFRPERPRT